jgi:hypothetical protein
VAWPEYTIEYRYGRSLYVIVVRNEGDALRRSLEVTIDGRVSEEPGIPLVDDGERHTVLVRPRITASGGRFAAKE